MSRPRHHRATRALFLLGLALTVIGLAVSIHAARGH